MMEEQGSVANSKADFTLPANINRYYRLLLLLG